MSQRITGAELAHWRRLYEAGLSGAQIADYFPGRASTTITRALRRIGVELRPNICAIHGHHTAPSTWKTDWCDDCAKTKPLNPRTGWCMECSKQPRRRATA